jgi:hypothetical protein
MWWWRRWRRSICRRRRNTREIICLASVAAFRMATRGRHCEQFPYRGVAAGEKPLTAKVREESPQRMQRQSGLRGFRYGKKMGAYRKECSSVRCVLASECAFVCSPIPRRVGPAVCLAVSVSLCLPLFRSAPVQFWQTLRPRHPRLKTTIWVRTTQYRSRSCMFRASAAPAAMKSMRTRQRLMER